MSTQSKTFAFLLAAATLAGASGGAFAQQAGTAGGGGGGGSSANGGGPTLTHVTSMARVPDNSTIPRQRPNEITPGCVSPTEGIRGVRPFQGPCGVN